MNRSFFVAGIALAVFGSSILFLPFFLDAYGLPKMAIAAIGALILALGLGAEGIKASSLWRPISALAAACALSWAFSADPAVAWLGVYSQPFHALALFAMAIVVFAAARATPACLLALPASTAAGLIVNAAFCALQLWRPGSFWGEPYSGRTIGTLGNPAFLGGWAAVCVPLALALIWDERRACRLLGWAGAASGAFVAISSGSRGAFLAALAGLWAFFWGLGRLRARRWHLAAILGLLAGLTASGAAIGRARSDPFRMATWGAAARAWAACPILGWGPETFPIANRNMKTAAHVRAIGNDVSIQASAHNDLLQAAATLGLLGLLAYLWLWGELYFTARRALAFFPIAPIAGAVGALAALFVQAKLNPIAIPTILTGAAAAGILAAADAFNWRFGRGQMIAWLGACALAISALWPIGYAVIAESLFVSSNTFFARGRLIEGAECIRAAQELSPTEAIYAQHRINRIMELSQWADLARRRKFAGLALGIAGRLARARPNDPGSWELLGVSQFFAAQQFRDTSMLVASVYSWRRAIQIDPLLDYSRANAEKAAAMLGNSRIVVEERAARALISDLLKK